MVRAPYHIDTQFVLPLLENGGKTCKNDEKRDVRFAIVWKTYPKRIEYASTNPIQVRREEHKTYVHILRELNM